MIPQENHKSLLSILRLRYRCDMETRFRPARLLKRAALDISFQTFVFQHLQNGLDMCSMCLLLDVEDQDVVVVGQGRRCC